MKVAGLIEYSPSQIECMVTELFKRRPDVKASPPVRLEWLIENSEDLALETDMALQSNHKVQGGIWKEPNTRKLTIFVDWYIATKRPWPEYNAVLGEEFAHIQLHQSLIIQVRSVEDFLALQRDPNWYRYERDARRYSRALRMPGTAFVAAAEETYREVRREFGFIEPDRMESHIQHRLAQQFRVPADDAQRRMRDMMFRIDERIQLSVLARQIELLPLDCIITAKPPLRQQSFSEFDLDS